MIGTEIIKAVLKTLFSFGDYVNMYEVIDDDMIRKPAIIVKKLKEYANGDDIYSVKINWRLLDKVIEAGGWWERDDGSRFFSSRLDISLTNKEVRTDCGDTYMDYSISFDDFLAMTDKIRELTDGTTIVKDMATEKILEEENDLVL